MLAAQRVTRDLVHWKFHSTVTLMFQCTLLQHKKNVCTIKVLHPGRQYTGQSSKVEYTVLPQEEQCSTKTFNLVLYMDIVRAKCLQASAAE
jgi:hypothetical protein